MPALTQADQRITIGSITIVDVAIETVEAVLAERIAKYVRCCEH